ncbi:DEAD/DEAH box helicase [Demequina aestuarii]|uniref:DEAD/DEAH box helicase n=1 Tax=Demequina aestuarii TaxID=327095 RepID=UPI0007845F1F|nr:DEAD/DEAH box helicase [Demequina aestuarii]
METAFPIQSATIADALAGRDVLGRARTGSGKTLGFGLPAIALLAQTGRPTPHRPRAVVLVPTRELAMQVNDALEPFAHSMHVSLRLIAGGLSMSKQIRSLERGVHLVIATPGRLADLVRRGEADLSETRIVVLDEADHMAQMGFMDEIEEILERVPGGAQRLLFSATLDGDVDKLVATSMTDPARHDVTGGDDGPSTMNHVVLHVPPHAKYQFATRIAARKGRTIVFVRSKLGCDRIAAQMRDAGVLAVALHGDKSQNERNAAITGFRAGTIPVLVATDVAARGIHVDHVDLVMQMDPPADHKDYTHRAGRTARAGEDGLVVTLALPHQRRTVEGLMDRAGIDATVTVLRQADEAAFMTLSGLTGAEEPSGEPVAEPYMGGAGRRTRESGRQDRGARSARPSRGDRGRRPAHGRAAEVAPTPQHEHAKARSELERRERELQAREREIALREQRLGNQGAPASEARTTNARDDRTPRSREGWATKSPSGRDAWKRKPGGKRDRRDDERPGRARDERNATGRRGERPSTGWSDERPSRGRGERPGRGRDERPASGPRDARSPRGRSERPTTGWRDERPSADRRTDRAGGDSRDARSRGRERDARQDRSERGGSREWDGDRSSGPRSSGSDRGARPPFARDSRDRPSRAPEARGRGPQRRDDSSSDARAARRSPDGAPRGERTERDARPNRDDRPGRGAAASDSRSTRPERSDRPERASTGGKKAGKGDKKKKGKGAPAAGRRGKPRPKTKG